MIGKLKVDIYESTGRHPINPGEVYTKEDITNMFRHSMKCGTKLYRMDDGYGYAWYLKNGDGGWGEFKDIDDYISGKVQHTILSNLEIIKDNRKK